MNLKAILLVGVLLFLGVEGRPQHSVPSTHTQPQPAVHQQPSQHIAPQPQQPAPVAPQPQQPVPVAPQPQQPAPVVPQSQQPAPVAPQPQQPAPVVPQPQQPAIVAPQHPAAPVATNPQVPHHQTPAVTPGIPPAEPVGNGKFAVVFTGRVTTWNMASQACQMIPVPAGATGVSLFTANTPSDSSWLAGRMNSPFGSSEYWVGLKSGPTYGTVSWVDGTPFTYSHSAILSGHDDPTKVFAMASPDGMGIKYDFLTPTDEADGYICQYRMPTAPAPASAPTPAPSPISAPARANHFFRRL